MDDIYAEIEFFMNNCDLEFCPPPMFDLPPPPPPPWLDNPPSCHGDCSSGPAQVSSLNNVQEIFHSISIIVVSSFVIVLSLLFFAILIWRRRLILLRKFGSRNELTNPSAAESDAAAGQKKSADLGGHRTLPNHYISDRQLVTDVHGRSTVRSVAGVSSASPSSTLMIGGMPFHIIQSKPEGLNFHQLQQQQHVIVGGHHVVGTVPTAGGGQVYPVYETIESDYSEKSSMYSDNSSSAGYTGQHPLQGGSTVVPYHLVQNPVHGLTGSLQHVNYTYAYSTYNPAAQAGNGSQAVIFPALPEVDNKNLISGNEGAPRLQGSVLHFNQIVGAGSGQDTVTAPRHLLAHRLAGVNQNRSELQQHPVMVAQHPGLVAGSLHAAAARPTTLQHTAAGGHKVLLRNLPASRRSKSFRAPGGDVPIGPPPPLPLPPIPTGEGPAPRPEVHESTISLQTPPDPKSSVTQL